LGNVVIWRIDLRLSCSYLHMVERSGPPQVGNPTVFAPSNISNASANTGYRPLCTKQLNKHLSILWNTNEIWSMFIIRWQL